MNVNQLTQETIELMKSAQANGEPLNKSFTQPTSFTTGLQTYDLSAPSQKLYPVLTPLRNRIPRVGGGRTIGSNWKAITNINVGNQRAGVSEGKRGGVINHELVERNAQFRGIGLEKKVSFESQYAARGFEDLRALAVAQTLQATMIEEEMILLGGNTSLKAGVTPTPTAVSSNDALGKISTSSLSIVCVALGLQAYWDVAGANNGAIGQSLNIKTAQVPAKITRPNADGSTDTFGGGSAQKSAAASVSGVGAGKKVTAMIPAVRGAVGYAWFWGDAGSEKLGAVTTSAKVEILADAEGTQTAASLPSEDNSTSILEFDGLLTQIALPDSGAYWADNKGSGLTSDGAGGVYEFEEAFANFFTRYRLSPDTIYINARDLVTLTKLIIGNGGAPLIKLKVDIENANSIRAGVVVGSYMNKITGDELNIVVHPNLPAGTYLFYSSRLPGYVQGIGNLLQVLTRQEYYQIEWPLRSREYEYGVYADELLQGMFMPAFGMITNVG
ncbi:hypothetical protein HMPREF3052_00455 [Neisseria sp. HMSC056A03]|uniref:hypothetical protein n=1 Tax=Neisseria sp. HMSC056A03 TaxID=1739544 RepID=UPI0008A4A056|nr:hypothetical protein [Neisseria sp. HMSC056A03]OFO28265.1 hypothetical protein HMPREF3052_00455 [Neisseria sp. HMSC056A03]